MTRFAILASLIALGAATPAVAVCLDPYGCDDRRPLVQQLQSPSLSYDYSVANPNRVAPFDPYVQEKRKSLYDSYQSDSYGNSTRIDPQWWKK
jgi:hypothetical protein